MLINIVWNRLDNNQPQRVTDYIDELKIISKNVDKKFQQTQFPDPKKSPPEHISHKYKEGTLKYLERAASGGIYLRYLGWDLALVRLKSAKFTYYSSFSRALLALPAAVLELALWRRLTFLRAFLQQAKD